MRVITACDEGVTSLLSCGDTVKCLVTYCALPICGALALMLKEKKMYTNTDDYSLMHLNCIFCVATGHSCHTAATPAYDGQNYDIPVHVQHTDYL